MEKEEIGHMAALVKLESETNGEVKKISFL